MEPTRVSAATLPGEVRSALDVEDADEVAFVDTGRGIVVCPADQAWYWTHEWQAGEREADEEIARGETRFFGSTEEFLAALGRAVDDPEAL
jgi:bifunctional DNA-binding transcriptional regulator/antitoxin component of YhaV-PrlF toxin-antitoxin module